MVHGPVGLLGTKALLCPPFLWLQEIGFIQPPWTPLISKGRFKQLLIREGRGSRGKGGTVKRNNSAALGQGLGYPSRDIHDDILELFCRYWNPHKVGKLMVCCPQAQRPQTSWNQKADDTDSYLPHNQPVKRMSTSWSRPLWPITIKLLTTLSKGEHTVLRALARCGPLCLAKQ